MREIIDVVFIGFFVFYALVRIVRFFPPAIFLFVLCFRFERKDIGLRIMIYMSLTWHSDGATTENPYFLYIFTKMDASFDIAGMGVSFFTIKWICFNLRRNVSMTTFSKTENNTLTGLWSGFMPFVILHKSHIHICFPRFSASGFPLVHQSKCCNVADAASSWFLFLTKPTAAYRLFVMLFLATVSSMPRQADPFLILDPSLRTRSCSIFCFSG